jgi:hypothetical protein
MWGNKLSQNLFQKGALYTVETHVLSTEHIPHLNLSKFLHSRKDFESSACSTIICMKSQKLLGDFKMKGNNMPSSQEVTTLVLYKFCGMAGVTSLSLAVGKALPTTGFWV